MILQSTETDNITLDLAKLHLKFLYDEEDQLIEGYITASLGVVEDYIHDKALKSIYTNTVDELIPVDEDSGDLMLYITDIPRNVEITSNLGVETLDKRSYSYADDYLYIPGVDGRTISGVSVAVGKYDKSPQITQARLLLIGDFMEFRENMITIRVNELPNGVKAILDNLTEGSL